MKIYTTCLVLFYKPPQSLLIVGQAAMKTQTLLGLSEPLQQDVNSGVELLSLQQGNKLTQLEKSHFTFCVKATGAFGVPGRGPAQAESAWTRRGCTLCPSECSAPASGLSPRRSRRGCSRPDPSPNV